MGKGEWKRCRLGEVCDIQIGGTPARKRPEFWSNEERGLPWASISDLQGKWVTQTSEFISELGAAKSSTKLVPAGTTLMSFKLTIGRVARAGRDLYTNEAIAAFYPKDASIDPEYLYYALPLAARGGAIDQAVKGATLNKSKLAALQLPVPPVSEQKKIAEILGSVDDAIQATRAVIEQTRKVKQGMLDELLTRGIGHTRFKWTKIGEVPEGWEVARVGEVADVAYGLTVNAARRKSDRRYPYLTVANIKNDGVHLGTVKDIGVLAGDVERYQLQHEDLLLVEGNGNPDSLGMPALWEDIGQTILHQNHLIRVRVCSDLTLPRWLYTCFQSLRCKRQIRRRAKTSSGLHTINSRVVRDIWVPVPPRMEQLRILGTLDSANGSLSQCTSNLARLDQVKRALVQMLLLQRESS